MATVEARHLRFLDHLILVDPLQPVRVLALRCSVHLGTGARPEVTRDNMGHSEIPTTLNLYSRTWWDERVNAVSRAVGAVFAAAAPKPPTEAANLGRH